MKNYIKVFALIAFIFVGVGLVSSEAQAAPACTAKAIGARSSAFDVSNGKATVKFKVYGSKNCRRQISASTFYAPSMNGRPYSKQILHQRVTKVYKPGTYKVSVSVPSKSTKAKGCFYQVDLTYGTHNQTPVLAYGHGKLNCAPRPAPKMIKVCDLSSKKIITIKESDFNSEIYSKNLADCEETPVPEMIEVCDLNSKEVIQINKSEFDSAKHSYNLSDCEETPVVPETPTPETPKAPTPQQPEVKAPAVIPETGIADVVGQLVGVTSLVAASIYYIGSRR